MILAAAMLAASVSHGAGGDASSGWNGTWTLDATRSTKGSAEGAAPAYRFTVGRGMIRWEIPALGEVVTGRIDGRPMTIRRRGRSDGMMLSVVADGPYVLRYAVSRGGRPFGSGVITLVEGGRAWVDITWAPGRAVDAAQLLYAKR